jgi:hypothetical protein
MFLLPTKKGHDRSRPFFGTYSKIKKPWSPEKVSTAQWFMSCHSTGGVQTPPCGLPPPVIAIHGKCHLHHFCLNWALVYQLFSALSIPLLASLEIHRELTIQAAEMGISLNHLISATRSQQEAGKKNNNRFVCSFLKC